VTAATEAQTMCVTVIYTSTDDKIWHTRHRRNPVQINTC